MCAVGCVVGSLTHSISMYIHVLYIIWCVEGYDKLTLLFLFSSSQAQSRRTVQ